MDFGLLPPEINSGRMYTGPGSGPLLAAAAGWDGLAADLHSTAASFGSVISALIAGWRGPSSTAMAAAAAPYQAWMSATAAQAEQTAAQAGAAASVFETAFAATVPPPVIAANRALLMSLIATNLFGQNTAAIAAAEADYAEMWAQDAAVMYGYAGSSSAASQLTPFQPPPRTTNPAGSGAQSVAVAHPTATSGVSRTLQSLATTAAAAAPTDPPFTPAEIVQTLLTSLANTTIGPESPVKLWDPFGGFYDLGVQSFLAPFSNFNMQQSYLSALGGMSTPAAGGAGPGVAGAMGPGTVGGLGPGIRVASSAAGAVSADLGRAGLVGSLSVPQGWVSAAPAIRSVAAVLPQSSLGAVPAAFAADGQGSLFGNMALSGFAGRAMAGAGGTVGGSIAGPAGAISSGTATTATIIVIPED